jgi:GntR family transcriptional repressor for pyruvate dehydrogenase complex
MTVAQQIVQEISARGYPPGTKLPAEREMLAAHEVGRGTLRESLRFLEMNGVLTVKPGPGGGPVVAEPSAQDLASTLGLFLELKGTPFSAIVEVRQVLEPAIAGLAASARDAGILDKLDVSIEAMAAHLDHEGDFLEFNEEFHRLVAEAADNPVFALLIGSLERITDGTRIGLDYPLPRRKAVLAAHRVIYKAIAAGDSERASAEMASHLQAFRRYTETHYPNAMNSRLRWSDIAP